MLFMENVVFSVFENEVVTDNGPLIGGTTGFAEIGLEPESQISLGESLAGQDPIPR